MTIVAGEIVVGNGDVKTVNEEMIKDEARELMEGYSKKLEKADQAAKQLLPYYQEMYTRETERYVGMKRWVGPGRRSQMIK